MSLSPEQEALKAELLSLERKWEAVFCDPDFEGHSGSPGEWIVERMDEIRTELSSQGKAP